MTSNPAQPGPAAPVPDRSGQQPSRDSEVKAAKVGYLGVIVLGPVIPLAIYAVGARRSPFLRQHAAAAVNLLRLDAWWTGRPLDRTRTIHLQRLDLTVAAVGNRCT